MIFPRALVYHGRKATVMKLRFNIKTIGAFGFQEQGEYKIRLMIQGVVFDLNYANSDQRSVDYRSLGNLEDEMFEISET